LRQSFPNLSDDEAVKLVGIGINSAEVLEGVEASDLEEKGFSPDEAAAILAKIGEGRQ